MSSKGGVPSDSEAPALRHGSLSPRWGPLALFPFEAMGPQPQRGQGEHTWSSASPLLLATVTVATYVFNHPVGATRPPGTLGWQVVLDSWGPSPMVIRSWGARPVPSSAQQGQLLGWPRPYPSQGTLAFSWIAAQSLGTHSLGAPW